MENVRFCNNSIRFVEYTIEALIPLIQTYGEYMEYLLTASFPAIMFSMQEVQQILILINMYNFS